MYRFFYKNKIKDKSMSKLILLAFALLIVGSFAVNENPKIPTPVSVNQGQKVTFSAVFPRVDKYLRETYWYYLRAANIVYQSSANTQKTFLFFVIYRNIVGTFLVITTWQKIDQTSQVNTFVRLGNGYAPGSESLYDAVKISPSVISLQLGEGQYMVTVNEDGTITVVGDYPKESSGQTEEPKFNVEKDMEEKFALVDTYVREKYWYYLKGAQNLHTSHTPTSERYYYISVYVNIVGTFMVIGNYELQTLKSNINTFVRLGNGYASDSEALYGPVNYAPVTLSPAVLEMNNFGK